MLFRTRWPLLVLAVIHATSAEHVQVVVKESELPNAGLGLFLSEDSGTVEPGTIVCFYGGEDASAKNATGDMLYAVSSLDDPDRLRVGAPWQGSVPHYGLQGEELGHLANDPAAILLLDPSREGPVLRGGVKDLEGLLTEYHKAAELKANVAHPEGPTWAMRAKRVIQPGEELLMSYGAEYWLSLLLYAPPADIDPFDRLVVYLYSIEHNVDELMRTGFVYLDEAGRPSVSTTGQVATEEQCALFLRTVGFSEGRGNSMAMAAGVTADMGPCEATRRLCIYANEPDIKMPPAPLSLEMVRKIQADLGQFLRLPTPNAWLEVRESSIPGAGLGLFLSSDSTPVAKDTILTVYGGRTMPTPLMENTAYALGIDNRPDIHRVGEPWQGEVPAMVMQDMAVGHLVNDGAVITLAEDADALLMGVDGLHELIDAYHTASMERQNIGFGHGKVVGCWDMVATREIQPGEELFFSYGYVYWLSRVVNRSPDPLRRLLAYLHFIEFHPQVLAADGFVYEDSEGKLVLWPSGVEIDDAYCAAMLRGYFGLEGEKGERALERAGVPEGLPAKETFKRLVAAVKQSGGGTTVAR